MSAVLSAREYQMNIEGLEQAIGYEFKNKALITTALTHTSYANEQPVKLRDNERLEFLGDSVLSFLVAGYLFESRNENEGLLTQDRARLVCEGALYKFAKKLGLGNYILLGKGEIQTGGRDKPSVLSDCLEAVIAAIYLDGGIENARRFIMNHLLGEADLADGKDYKTLLQEVIQQNPEERLRYVVTDESGPDHAKSFTVAVMLNSNEIASGTGNSKKNAEQQAAKQALKLLGL